MIYNRWKRISKNSEANKMDIYGIKNISECAMKFYYDKHYKQVAVKLKSTKTEVERNEIKELEKKKLYDLNNIEVNLEELKENFINLILDKDSSKYLWILYSMYEDGENYIDKISDVLRRQNKVIRGGTNTYKMNGWMAHTLYVYQIVNNNIAKNVELPNFEGNVQNKIQIEELNKIYKELNNESKFVLKVYTLIHDIGVLDGVKDHDQNGMKYVEKVLEEIGLTKSELDKNNIKINFEDLIQTLKIVIKYHTLITSLSTEGSDKYVENSYRNLINAIPNVEFIRNNIPKILLILAYADIIAVDDSLLNEEKYNRIKEGYYFFESVTQNKIPIRNKEKVAIERICDTVGKIAYEDLKNSLDNILAKYGIDKSRFIQNMYNIKIMKFAGPLMKTVNNPELTIRIYHEIFDIICQTENKEALKDYTIIFVPDRHENDFVEQFENGNFFKCAKIMKETKENKVIYRNVKIEKGTCGEGMCLYISVI